MSELSETLKTAAELVEDTLVPVTTVPLKVFSDICGVFCDGNPYAPDHDVAESWKQMTGTIIGGLNIRNKKRWAHHKAGLSEMGAVRQQIQVTEALKSIHAALIGHQYESNDVPVIVGKDALTLLSKSDNKYLLLDAAYGMSLAKRSEDAEKIRDVVMPFMCTAASKGWKEPVKKPRVLAEQTHG